MPTKSESITPPRRWQSRRSVLAAVIVLALIPATILFGVYFMGDRRYYFISLLLLLYTMIPFALHFEGRRPQARELVVLATLTAIAVAGRAAFFMTPQFKPVAAIVIITGVCFGAESGFLVGALTGFVSNFFFGQGPWTPWQMFAFGVIGLLAGAFTRIGWLRKTPLPLCVYGGLSTLIIYGGLLGFATAVNVTPQVTWPALLTAYAAGIWFDVVHAASTVVFLLLLARPMIEKLERIRIKYGILDHAHRF